MAAPAVEEMRKDDLPSVVLALGPELADEVQLRGELERPWARIWIAREPDGGVGAFALAWHVADELHLLNIATRPDHRRRGFALALMDEILSYARRRGLRCVLLEVRLSNQPALALYRRLGFSDARIRSRYYPDGEDALEMSLMMGPAA